MTQTMTTKATTTMRPALRRGLLLAALGAGLYALLLGLLWFQQERLLFQPAPLAAGHRFALGDDVHERWIDVPGARLNALHLRLPKPDGLVFFLHGNGGNLQNWFTNADFYRRLNLDLFIIDYRGYGKSSGRIDSQAQLEADVRAAWDAVAPMYAGQRRIVYGRSLGTGLAATLAADVQPELTVLVSPYTSMTALAGEHYAWVPSAVLRYPLHTDDALLRIEGDVLLVHGERDTLISAEHSRRLQALAPRAKLLLVPDAGHNDIHRFETYLDGLRAIYRPSESATHSLPRRTQAPSAATCCGGVHAGDGAVGGGRGAGDPIQGHAAAVPVSGTNLRPASTSRSARGARPASFSTSPVTMS